MDVSSKTAVFRLLAPKIPLMFKTAIFSLLYLSPTSTKWSLRTELIVRVLQSLVRQQRGSPLLKQQQASLKDPGIKGKLWISKVTFPAPPTNDILDLLVTAIEDLKESPAESYTTPSLLPVEAEWTGYNASASADSARPDLPESEQYENLMSSVTTPVTILYFHGGAHVLMDPASHRIPCSRLAHLTGGRCLSVRYRLAPQNPFPAAVLDAFVAYLSLLYPPPGSFHSRVPANEMVLAGDSAGGNVCLALVQLLLQINRTHASNPSSNPLSFHPSSSAITFPIPLPAGCATSSAWADMTSCLPSKYTNENYDYLPSPPNPKIISDIPSDEIWPTNPPRGDVYCETSMLAHPLVSPLAAKDWKGSCPIWFGYGEEMLVDEGKQVASLIARQGGEVVWEMWEAMPHCFPFVLPGTWMTKKFFGDWAAFCRDVVGATLRHDGGGKEGEVEAMDKTPEVVVAREVTTHGIYFGLRPEERSQVDVETLGPFSDEEVWTRMKGCREKRHMVPEPHEPKRGSKL